jgi:phosphoenolpyruvate synthase/pyruvate phosphate dikinase
MHIHWFDDGPTPTDRVGGKGLSLIQMQHAGLPVPPGFCVTTEAYRLFEEELDLRPHVERLSATADLADREAALAAVTPLRERLQDAGLPTPLESAVREAYEALCARFDGPTRVAARSSAVSEDGSAASFAGIYESYLHLLGAERIQEAIVDCYRALWDPRAVQYRAMRGMSHANEAMAVVVMAMVPADVSGVAFTANPITGSRDEILINAAWGLGEAVVSGQVTPDNIVATKADGSVVEYEPGDKNIEITLDTDAGAGTVSRPVAADRAAARCLTDEDVALIAELACRAEAHYGTPQDIEFARAGGEWFLLQSRPITGLQ